MQEIETERQTQSFRKSLGLFELVSLGVGGTIGSGIFIAPGVAARISGHALLLAWLVVAISASCVLVSLAGVSSRFRETRSFLAFSRQFSENA